MPVPRVATPNEYLLTGGSTSLNGISMNQIAVATTATLASAYSELTTQISSLNPNDPAALLNVQFAMSKYENVVQTASQLFSAISGLIKDIIQNIR